MENKPRWGNVRWGRLAKKIHLLLPTDQYVNPSGKRMGEEEIFYQQTVSILLISVSIHLSFLVQRDLTNYTF